MSRWRCRGWRRGVQIDQFHLGLPAAAIGARQIVTVSYAVPATGTVIEDTAGNDAPPFTDRPVTNNSTLANTTPPVLVSAEVGGSGDRLALIRDTDGLPSGFDYRWVRVATDSTETDIGTNSSRYSPGYSDVGTTIRVEVSFTDGAGNAEGPLASDTVGPVTAPTTTGTCPADSDWRATLTMGYAFDTVGGRTTPQARAR